MVVPEESDGENKLQVYLLETLVGYRQTLMVWDE